MCGECRVELNGTPVLKELSTQWERKTRKWLIPLHCGEWCKREKFQMLLDLTEGAAKSAFCREVS